MGYGTQEAIPKCSNGSPSLSDSDSDTNQSFTHSRVPTVMVDDVIPSTSLLWGEESISSDPLVSTSQDLHEDSFRGRQRYNLAQLIKQEGIMHNDEEPSTSRHPKPSW